MGPRTLTCARTAASSPIPPSRNTNKDHKLQFLFLVFSSRSAAALAAAATFLLRRSTSHLAIPCDGNAAARQSLQLHGLHTCTVCVNAENKARLLFLRLSAPNPPTLPVRRTSKSRSAYAASTS